VIASVLLRRALEDLGLDPEAEEFPPAVEVGLGLVGRRDGRDAVGEGGDVFGEGCLLRELEGFEGDESTAEQSEELGVLAEGDEDLFAMPSLLAPVRALWRESYVAVQARCTS
jgi:hypothetical protein